MRRLLKNKQDRNIVILVALTALSKAHYRFYSKFKNYLSKHIKAEKIKSRPGVELICMPSAILLLHRQTGYKNIILPVFFC